MRNRVRERLQVLVDGDQVRRAFHHALFQFLVEPPHLLLNPFALHHFLLQMLQVADGLVRAGIRPPPRQVHGPAEPDDGAGHEHIGQVSIDMVVGINRT